MTPALFLAAAVGCAIGATARYAISRLGRPGAFPWPTVLSNVLGSALFGAAAGAVVEGTAHAGWLLVLGAGVGGGLSTFSTLGVDAVILWRDQRRRAMLVYLLATFVTGLTAAWLGWSTAIALA